MLTAEYAQISAAVRAEDEDLVRDLLTAHPSADLRVTSVRDTGSRMLRTHVFAAAMTRKRPLMMILLLEHGVPMSAGNDTGCYVDPWSDLFGTKADWLPYVLEFPYAVNWPSEKDGRTPLMRAAGKGLFEACQQLLGTGVDVDAETTAMISMGSSAAVTGRRKRVVPAGSTALTFAVVGGHANVAALLLHSGCPVDRCIEELASPILKAAVENAYWRVAELALSYGAEVRVLSEEQRGQLKDEVKERPVLLLGGSRKRERKERKEAAEALMPPIVGSDSDKDMRDLMALHAKSRRLESARLSMDASEASEALEEERAEEIELWGDDDGKAGDEGDIAVRARPSYHPNLVAWLDYVKKGYAERYLDAFVAEGLEDMDEVMVYDLDERKLRDMGVKKAHACRMLKALSIFADAEPGVTDADAMLSTIEEAKAEKGDSSDEDDGDGDDDDGDGEGREERKEKEDADAEAKEEHESAERKESDEERAAAAAPPSEDTESS
eukprot:PLAT11297.1.p1 GENE.PLAT11297.1~~PLAT11297.1.p1  ORF type:complete len:496 (-),score=169.70 PLAT11297.1:56-1543(-)